MFPRAEFRPEVIFGLTSIYPSPTSPSTITRSPHYSLSTLPSHTCATLSRNQHGRSRWRSPAQESHKVEERVQDLQEEAHSMRRDLPAMVCCCQSVVPAPDLMCP